MDDDTTYDDGGDETDDYDNDNDANDGDRWGRKKKKDVDNSTKSNSDKTAIH